MYELFIASLLCLCFASVGAFIVGFRNKYWILSVFVPIIALCGSFIYFSYIAVLGYPVKLEWDQLPKKITVIYFKISGKDFIDLWLIENATSRLVRLPYVEPVEDTLEGVRGTLGGGTPVTLKRVKEVAGNSSGGGGEGDGDGVDGRGGDRQGKKGNGTGGWKYIIDSFGEPIPGSFLPPK